MKLETLHDCFALKVMALYDIENEVLKALPKMIKTATNAKLREAFSDHLTETEAQIVRLEKMFEILDVKPKKVKVEAIRGIIKDAQWLKDQDTIPVTLDTLLIGAARHVEHYEMSGYMTLLQWSKMLGFEEVEVLVTESLEEEKNADSILSDLAEEVATEANNGKTDERVSTDSTESDETEEDSESEDSSTDEDMDE